MKIEPREVVARFAEVMEQELRANDHKPGWSEDSPLELFERLTEEAEELRLELKARFVHFFGDVMIKTQEEASRIVKEAADVANFAMMIADIIQAKVSNREVAKPDPDPDPRVEAMDAREELERLRTRVAEATTRIELTLALDVSNTIARVLDKLETKSRLELAPVTVEQAKDKLRNGRSSP